MGLGELKFSWHSNGGVDTNFEQWYTVQVEFTAHCTTAHLE